MVENWQSAIGSEGRSPLLKNDSSGAKKCPDISRQTHTYTIRAAAKVMKLCSSTSLDSAQLITVQSCLSWGREGLDRLFQDVWHISKMRSVCSFNWIQQCLITGSMNHTCLLPVINVFICRLYSSSALDFIQDHCYLSLYAILHHLNILFYVFKFYHTVKISLKRSTIYGIPR